MDIAGAVFPQVLNVFAGRIALVLGKTILWI